MSKTGGVLVIVGIVLILITGIIGFERGAIAQGQYQRVIGDYALNAADAPTFEQSITFLQKFNDSMNQQGLTADMYNTPWSWEQTPQNQMNFQYSYVGQMIVRAHYYINYTSANSATKFTDIYNQALTAFRNEMQHNGPLDWVAQDAWMLKNGYYWQYFYATGVFALACLCFVAAWIAWPNDD